MQQIPKIVRNDFQDEVDSRFRNYSTLDQQVIAPSVVGVKLRVDEQERYFLCYDPKIWGVKQEEELVRRLESFLGEEAQNCIDLNQQSKVNLFPIVSFPHGVPRKEALYGTFLEHLRSNCEGHYDFD